MESIERSCICGPLSFSYILWPTQDLMDSHLLPGIIWAVRQKKEEKKLRSCFLLNEFLVHDQLFLFFSFFWPLRSLGPSAYAISFLFSLRKDNERKCIQAQENTSHEGAHLDDSVSICERLGGLSFLIFIRPNNKLTDGSCHPSGLWSVSSLSLWTVDGPANGLALKSGHLTNRSPKRKRERDGQ